MPVHFLIYLLALIPVSLSADGKPVAPDSIDGVRTVTAEQAIELILEKHQHRAHARLNFNYLTRTTETWCDDADQKARRYHANYPKGLSVEI